MSNNKQSSVEWFAQQLYETLEIRGDGYVIDSLLDLAKAMHKEEIKNAFTNGFISSRGSNRIANENFYNETFDNNEHK